MRFLRFATVLVILLCSAPLHGQLYDEQGFRRAVAPYEYEFPRDHGSHPEFRTEWWYFTGNVQTPEGRPFGYELTIFRSALLPPGSELSDASELVADQVYVGHFAISDIDNEAHKSWERIGREGFGQASASTETLDVKLQGWHVRFDEEGAILLDTQKEDAGLSLRLVPAKPPVLHGQNGVHQKSGAEGEASHYIAFTRLQTEGTLTWRGERYEVSGSSWMDHEFFTNSMSADQVGWDWFALQFDDGRDLMVYQMREADGSWHPVSSGTLVREDGTWRELPGDSYTIEPTGEWTSPDTGAVYPMGWRIAIPEYDAELVVEETFPNQEMLTGRYTGVVYWEGAVRVRGTWSGEPVNGVGYVELVGYAEEFSLF